MKRFIRLAVLAVGTLALTSTTAPPAGAATVIDSTFVGRLTVDGGIGYPTPTNLPVLSVPTTDCLDPLPDGNPVPNCHTHYNDHVRAVHFWSTTCLDTTTNVAKPNKPPAHTGACSFGGSGHISGHCGLSGGQIDGTYVDSLGQVYSFRFHFTEDGVWTITGHVTKQADGQTGKITGTANAGPDPFAGQSCINKTQQEFTLSGQFTITTI